MYRRVPGARFNGISAAALLPALAITLFAGLPVALAEQLPIRRYGVYEGLPHSTVRCIFQDSRGYLWIGTADGLARFDGYRFTTYDRSDGLGHTFINSIAEDQRGRVWIATNGGGVACFIDWAPEYASAADLAARPARPKFVSFKLADKAGANRVNALLSDSHDRLWCATDAGLFRAIVQQGKVESLDFELLVPHGQATLAMGAFADSRGRLWFGNGNMIIEASGDQILTYGPSPEFGREIRCFAEDHQGRLMAASNTSIFAFTEPDDPARLGSWRRGEPAALSNNESPYCLLVDSTGALWVGTEHGLIKHKDGTTAIYTTSNGLSNNFIHSFCQDRDGNLWVGTDNGGLNTLSAEPVVAFGRSDGLPDATVVKLFEDRSGRVYVSTRGAGLLEMTVGKASPVKWSQVPAFSAIGQRIRQDGRGDWWIGTDRGLFWFRGPDLHHARGRQITEAEGGPGTGVAGDIYRDSQGKVWFGSRDAQLYCIDSSGQDGRPEIRSIPLTSRFPYLRIVVDRQGNVWGGTNALLSRIVGGQDSLLQPSGDPAIDSGERRLWDKAEKKLPPAEGLPEILPRAFFLDSRGWLWIGLRNRGVSVSSAPSADSPSFVNYSTADGLASNTVWSITEDDAGRIYLATGRGLNRLEPLTGRIRHITGGAALAGETLVDCMRDSRGNIWAATTSAILRLNPSAEPDAGRAPPIYLTRLRVSGDEVPMPDAGATIGPSLRLDPSGNDILIEYVALDFRSDRELKYQYKLEGVDTDWRPPTDQRSVNYASLAPGAYKFMVRAVNQQGIVSPEPAVVELRILPPIWRRWWFMLAAASMVALAAYAVHRNRMKRLLELLTVRTRIASDLHDDIGSNLTKIAILSEVVHQQLGPLPGTTESPLTAIARISRESVASMSDIVWAVDPRRDTDQDLVRRMRQFAIDMLGGAGAEVRIVVSGDERSQRLSPEFRRQIFLAFKEAINNAARHSGCSMAELDVRAERSGLDIKIQDNGTGFDPSDESQGQGLASMRRRIEGLGGQLDLTISNQGTLVHIFAPWTRPRTRSRKSKPRRGFPHLFT